MGQSDCVNCLPGKISTGIAAATPDCIDCDPGRFSSGSGSFYCASCAPGTTQPFAAQTSCIECGAGRYVDVSGRSRDAHEVILTNSLV